MDTTAITKLKPKTLAIIAVGGIGLGLAWKHFSGRGGAASAGTLNGVDTSQLAMVGSSTGNLSAPTATGSALGNVDTGTTREVGSISFPVVKWVVTIGGVEYLTDGVNLWPLGTSNPTPDNSTPHTPPDISVPIGGVDPRSQPGSILVHDTPQ